MSYLPPAVKAPATLTQEVASISLGLQLMIACTIRKFSGFLSKADSLLSLLMFLAT